MIVAHTGNQEPKDSRFYLDSALEVHICYNILLFNTYNEENLLLVHTADQAKLIILGKGMVTLDVLVNGKPKVVNFCNVLYALELEYNLLPVDIIKKAGYLIIAIKDKMSVFDNKDNVIFEATRIRTSYLINVPASKKNLTLSSILLLGKVELKWYNINSEKNPPSHI